MSTTGEAADVDGVGQLVASTSTAVQHLSLSDLAICEVCKPSPRPAEVFCPTCGVFLCKSCDSDTVHKEDSFLSRHERMMIEEYRLVERSLGRSSPTDKQIEADSRNTLCCINPLDRDIVLQPRIASLVPDPDALPSLVAFVGPTGVGKSTLMRLLISLDGRTNEADMPLVGAPQDSLPTTADLHMYGGGQEQTPSQAQYPLLYVDSEGRGGLKELRAIHNLWKSFHHIYRHKLGEYEDFNKSRSKHVRQSYPRLLYIFSDVLCFVFTGSWREHESILTPLLEWVQSGAFGAVNQHRPQLFLIFNKWDKDALKQEYNDFRKTYETWIHELAEWKIKLEFYYSDPQICLIPEGHSSPHIVLQRVKLLRARIFSSTERIRRSREEANQLFTRRQLHYYMQLAVDSFNKSPTCEFDIYKESMARRPTATGLAKCIVEFRRAVSEHANSASSKKKRHKESLEILGGRFKCSVLLWIDRLKTNPPLGPHARLPEDLQTDLEKAQEWMDGEEPCAAVKDNNMHRCDTMRHMHGDSLHASRDVRWSGDFARDPEVEAAVVANNLVNLANSAIRTTTPLNVRTIREQLLQVRGSERDNYPWLQSFISYKACGSCIFELPTEVLSCSHIICAKCAKEEADPSSLKIRCPICLSRDEQWYPNDLPPLAGYRILSLDGGGIRGIVELLSLKEIMSFFPKMHVEDLFDIIAGTSTGGIIALALTVHKLKKKPKRLEEVMKLFESLSKSVFSPDMLRPLAEFSFVLRFCQFFRIYDTKYKNYNLLKLLKKHFGEELLLRSCVGGPRVVVTSCARDNKCAAVWFTSYNRPTLKNECNDLLQETTEQSTQKVVPGRVHDNHIFTPKDAAAATSAAGTYFPAYNFGSQFWVDGGIRNNCPAEVAIKEARILWPNHKASALISLGCAQLSSDKELRNSDGLRAVVNALKIVVLDAETQSEKAISYLKDIQPDLKDIQPDSSGCGIRLNPTIKVPNGEKYELDDAEKIPALKEMTVAYLRGDGRANVEKAANLLWAAQFYLEVEFDEFSLEPKLDMLHIRSRAPLPPDLKDALIAASRSSTPPFSGIVHEARNNAEFEFLWDECTWDQGIMNLPFQFNGYTLISSVTVTIYLRMCLPRTSASEEWPLPISGMPWKVGARDW